MDEVRAWKANRVEPGRHLDASLERALAYLFCAFEGACGVRSVQGSIQDTLVSGTSVQFGSKLGAVDARGNPLLLSAEAWADGEHEAKAGLRRGDTLRASRTIARLAGTRQGRDAVTVLYRLFGPKDPSAPVPTFGLVLAPLACLTPTAERLAREHAREEARRTLTAAEGTVLARSEALAAAKARPCRPRRPRCRSRGRCLGPPLPHAVAYGAGRAVPEETCPGSLAGCLARRVTLAAPERARVDVKLHLLAVIAETKDRAPKDREVMLTRIKAEATMLAVSACALYTRAFRELHP